MKRFIIGLSACMLVACLAQAALYASGTIAAGKGINPRDAYTMGKALTFQKLVCPSCPLQKRDLDRDRALSLKNSLEARDEPSSRAPTTTSTSTCSAPAPAKPRARKHRTNRNSFIST